MLRFGLVGCGTHANWAVIPAIAGAAPQCRLVAVADINPDNLRKAELPPDVARFPDHRGMFAEAKLDAVYVATLADTHAQIAIDALQAGLHVVCEKPMATSREDCRRMLEAADKARRLLTVNFESRYHPEMRQVREWVQAGHLGRVEAIHIQQFWDGHKIWGDIGARRQRLMELAGGLDCGIHKSDIARYLCGGHWKEIIARGRWLGESVSKPPHIAILATLDNGVMATINISMGYGAQMKSTATSNVLTVVGNRGVINAAGDHASPAAVHLHSDTLTASCPLEDPGHAQVMVQMLRDFAAAAEGAPLKPELATGDDGLQSQIFVDEANRQAIEHREP